jgi:hypothetical protein
MHAKFPQTDIGIMRSRVYYTDPCILHVLVFDPAISREKEFAIVFS